MELFFLLKYLLKISFKMIIEIPSNIAFKKYKILCIYKKIGPLSLIIKITYQFNIKFQIFLIKLLISFTL
jgi:hypothetical protein